VAEKVPEQNLGFVPDHRAESTRPAGAVSPDVAGLDQSIVLATLESKTVTPLWFCTIFTVRLAGIEIMKAW